jgi:hypothetical protein
MFRIFKYLPVIILTVGQVQEVLVCVAAFNTVDIELLLCLLIMLMKELLLHEGILFGQTQKH